MLDENATDFISLYCFVVEIDFVARAIRAIDCTIKSCHGKWNVFFTVYRKYYGFYKIVLSRIYCELTRLFYLRI